MINQPGVRGRAVAVLSTIVAVGVLGGCADGRPTAPGAVAAEHGIAARAARARTYTTIDVPGALATSPQGINAGGDVAGAYFGTDGKWHGFVLKGGTITSFDYPGAAGTQARGIGPSGEVVGSYWLPGEPGVASHGFFRSADGELAAADYPGHLYTIPQRILPDGTILGCRHDQDTMGSMKGVAFGPRGSTEITAYASMSNGATPDGRRVVGLFTNMTTNRGEAFIIDDGEFTAYAVPGSTMTAAWDVNARGQVAGVYRNASGFHGFVLTDGELETIDFPGAAATRVFGINAAGDVVGVYAAGGVTHGFRASATGR